MKRHLLLLLAVNVLSAFAEDKKPAPFIPSDVQIAYWRARSIMMDARMDLANKQMFGADGHAWNAINAEVDRTQREYDKAFEAVKAACTLDMPALAKDKILQCAKP